PPVGDTPMKGRPVNIAEECADSRAVQKIGQRSIVKRGFRVPNCDLFPHVKCSCAWMRQRTTCGADSIKYCTSYVHIFRLSMPAKLLVLQSLVTLSKYY